MRKWLVGATLDSDFGGAFAEIIKAEDWYPIFMILNRLYRWKSASNRDIPASVLIRRVASVRTPMHINRCSVSTYSVKRGLVRHYRGKEPSDASQERTIYL